MQRYSTLKEYIEARLDAIGETKAHLSQQLGWGPSYISNIISGQFKPNEDRCKTLARVFGDDPNIILALAGFYVPHQFTPREDHLLASFRSLEPRYQREVEKFIRFQKYLQDTEIQNAPEETSDELTSSAPDPVPVEDYTE